MSYLLFTALCFLRDHIFDLVTNLIKLTAMLMTVLTAYHRFCETATLNNILDFSHDIFYNILEKVCSVVVTFIILYPIMLCGFLLIWICLCLV